MKQRTVFPIMIGLLLLAALLLFGLFLLSDRPYSHQDFSIDPVLSPVDFNQNGTDDYTDFLLGARQDAENHPTYDPAYWDGGYPPDELGVCTDVVWRAFRQAGYSLRQMVDSDIRNRPEAYPNAVPRDSNIDFRRVPNLHVFFSTYAISLTTDIDAVEEWQPGDIVIFGEDQHIGIVSSLRNSDGQPFIIHNGGQSDREEDYLPRATVTAHYRFDASLIDADILAPWGEGL